MIELTPKRVEAVVTELTDTTIRVDIPGRVGVITVPRRHVFAEKEIKVGQRVEFYFSYLQVIDE